MTDTPPYDDDPVELDPALAERVRAALRAVPEQDPEAAERALDSALGHLSTVRRRQPVWLAVAAAGVVAVLGVAVIGGGADDDDLATPELAAVPTEAPLAEEPGTDAPLAEARVAAAPAAPFGGSAEVDLVTWVRERQAVETPVCPLQAGERSFGVRPWEGVDVEVLVDEARATIRAVDAASCVDVTVIALTP